MRHSVCFLLLVSCVLIGCGGADQPSGRLTVYPVGGTVLYKGRPVGAADVTFICAEKDKSAFGRTDEQGKFRLTTYSSNDGAVEGKHVVVVSKIAPPVQTSPQYEPEDPRYDPVAVEKAALRVPVKNDLPAKYMDAKKSDLIVVVNADGNSEDLKLELKD
ncbi:hypothetical protein Pan44_00630 [Caulifigura coniformis]|uniref:Carboxypeptidase regulatory-like domain-containing protein n=1 Tax=Caulifigura coniformis TaxID=2527983 RepID=A0A517S7G9_9PLAN|nr:DUF4198 domain-containing protein [Caulifigura coniformis]QDT52055.1 hypothetical protein Pan44_00630 [Caulifigura coniformis]